MFETWLIDHEPVLRGLAFFGVLVAMAGWEALSPRRGLQLGRKRWFANLGIAAINTVLPRLAAPAGLAGLAAFAAARGWGVFNAVEAPWWFAFAASFLALDLAVWAQHVAFHAVPALWPMHRMHHADLDFDTTTGLRFHPFEIAISTVYKGAAIIALGAPVAAVLMFEIVLNAMSLFNHGNVRIPRALDRILRAVLVTPDMHRVHHSDRPEETNSNFGFNFSWWDRLFGFYRAQPAKGHDAMTIGLEAFRDPTDQRFDRLLVHPFLPAKGNAPVKPRRP